MISNIHLVLRRGREIIKRRKIFDGWINVFQKFDREGIELRNGIE